MRGRPEVSSTAGHTGHNNAEVGDFAALDLLRRIRQTTDETDVVVISSKVDNRQEYLNEGAIEFISKPLENFQGLMRKLQTLIEVIDSEPL